MLTLTTALAFLAFTTTALAGWNPQCKQICPAPDEPNLLVTHCGEDFWQPDLLGGDANYVWSAIDLNQIVGYEDSALVFKVNGNFASGDDACYNPVFTDGTLYTDCADGPAQLDISNLINVRGSLCSLGDFFTICGEPTSRTC